VVSGRRYQLAFGEASDRVLDTVGGTVFSEAMFPVSSEKARALQARMEQLGVREDDLEEQFVRSRGHGGQNVNKVATCVILRHRPTGTVVRCQRERSQALNRFLARRELLDRIEARVRGAVAAAEAERARIRRQKRRRSRRAKEKMLADKRARGATKAARRAPVADD
jgi:protein subunit release factor B